MMTIPAVSTKELPLLALPVSTLEVAIVDDAVTVTVDEVDMEQAPATVDGSPCSAARSRAGHRKVVVGPGVSGLGKHEVVPDQLCDFGGCVGHNY